MPIGINPVRGPAHVQAPEKSNFDKNMDSVARALGIANAGMGIAVNYQKFNQVREQRDLAPQQELDRTTQAAATLGETKARTAQTQALTSNLPSPEQSSRAFEQKLTQSTQAAQQKLADGKLKNAMDFRREWTKDPITQATKQGKVSIDKIRSAGVGEPSAAKDHAMIFNYMKTVDPGSTVREGEFATVQQAGGAIDRATIGLFNKALEGEMLTPGQRADFLKVSEDLWQQQVNSQQNLNQQYQDLAGRGGVDPEDVVLDLGINAAQKQRSRAGAGGIPLAPGAAEAGTLTEPGPQGDEQPPQFDFSGFGADAGTVEAAVSQMPEKDRARFLRRLQEKKAAAAGGQ